MKMIEIIPTGIDFVFPDTLLSLLKAVLDILCVVAFIILFIVILYARQRYPVFKRRKIILSLILFNVLGIISMTMDAIDEFFWFSPKAFYDQLWKPTRLLLFLIAVFLLLYAFAQFYQFSKRILPSQAEE